MLRVVEVAQRRLFAASNSSLMTARVTGPLCQGLFSRAFSSTGEEVDFGFKAVPKDEKQRLVGQVFSNVAESYDVMNDLMSAGMHRLWKDYFVGRLSPFPGMRHLDVAGGTGDIAFRVIEAARRAEHKSGSEAKAHVTVCDINASMLKEGGKRAAKLGYSSADLDWVVGNAEALPFADDSMDSYTIAFGIRNVTNKDAALRDAYRVLRPGGRLMVLEFSHVTVPGLREFYDAYSFNVIPAMGQLVANDRNSYQYLVESIRKFPPQAEFQAMMCDAGFSNTSYENLTGGMVAIHSGFK
mmetsp:Transcript_15670/g.27776  ORF Transcript_15670/g.27776 Transcript_15670/m.27776 type:complete len:297 (-) Transcript_15670:395-1285(-)|eukprot:CAMPEP_0177754426 /NCGR_PEP_ID=MMETSP0491_2-20121128/2005_1 /TAXON_ID=63592 /ORGANISM="Tetraselmis chuii, Strain PLY429" /LENGTH=296 /DNA_ID=CAMNT_0019269813 /DNA_START=356 /DNA_END=1246 /DNA_ORIENTATION=+